TKSSTSSSSRCSSAPFRRAGRVVAASGGMPVLPQVASHLGLPRLGTTCAGAAALRGGHASACARGERDAATAALSTAALGIASLSAAGSDGEAAGLGICWELRAAVLSERFGRERHHKNGGYDPARPNESPSGQVYVPRLRPARPAILTVHGTLLLTSSFVSKQEFAPVNHHRPQWIGVTLRRYGANPQF